MMDFNLRRDELELWGCSPAHKKILICISQIAKPVALISKQTGIPLTSVIYMLNKLQEKSFVTLDTNGKKKVWRSNIKTLSRFISNLEKGNVKPLENGI